MLTSIALRVREKVLYLPEHAFVLQRRFPLGLRVTLQEVALRLIKRRGDAHGDVDVVIAAAGALEELDAFGPQSEDLTRLRAGGDAQRLGAVDGVDLHVRAEGRLGEGDGLIGMDVVIAARELRVRVDGEEDVEIARRTAVEACLPFAGDAQTGALVNAGGGLDRDGLLLPHPAC